MHLLPLLHSIIHTDLKPENVLLDLPPRPPPESEQPPPLPGRVSRAGMAMKGVATTIEDLNTALSLADQNGMSVEEKRKLKKKVCAVEKDCPLFISCLLGFVRRSDWKNLLFIDVNPLIVRTLLSLSAAASSVLTVGHPCFALYVSIQKLKKKKQAAKRKGISTEEADGGTDPASKPAPEQPTPAPEGGAMAADAAEDDAEKAATAPEAAVEKAEVEREVKGRAEDVPEVPSVDMEMPDTSEVVEVQVEMDVGGADIATSIEKEDTIVVTEEGLPAPPAAPTNGNLSSVVGRQHKKSVSFVMAEADIETLASGVTGSDGSAAKAVPPLPPATLHTIGNADMDNGNAAAGTNEAFLRRNFSLGGHLEQVQTCAFGIYLGTLKYLY